jgi:hypothetical protein
MEVFEQALEFKRFQPLPHLGDLSSVIVAGPQDLGARVHGLGARTAGPPDRATSEESNAPATFQTAPGQG